MRTLLQSRHLLRESLTDSQLILSGDCSDRTDDMADYSTLSGGRVTNLRTNLGSGRRYPWPVAGKRPPCSTPRSAGSSVTGRLHGLRETILFSTFVCVYFWAEQVSDCVFCYDPAISLTTNSGSTVAELFVWLNDLPVSHLDFCLTDTGLIHNINPYNANETSVTLQLCSLLLVCWQQAPHMTLSRWPSNCLTRTLQRD